MKSKLDRYVSNLDMSDKRPKDSGIKYQTRQGNNDRDFRGFKRVNDTTSNITFGNNAQRTGDAGKFSTVEGGTTKSSMRTSGDHEYVYKGSSGSAQVGEGTKGSKGSW